MRHQHHALRLLVEGVADGIQRRHDPLVVGDDAVFQGDVKIDPTNIYFN